LGFGVVGVFAVVVSCSSDNGGSGAPAGFGKSCSSDKECAAYELLCSEDDECVQCLDASDCKRSETCAAGLCRGADDCESSRDCNRDQVCDEGLGLCVDCVSSDDCLNGQSCVKNACVEQQTCKATRDCDDGLVCDPDGLCVECVEDSDCSSGRTCRDNVCKLPDGGDGSGGADGAPMVGDGGTRGDTGGTSSGGTSSGGTSGGGTSSGGTSSGGSHNGGSAGTGGSGNTCSCVGDDVCTPDERCVAPTVLDDLHDCDDEILAIEGRSGTWAADADTDINLMYGFGNPGSSWADHSCAAWATGGIAPSAIDVSFAFIGFQLHDGSAYDLSDYTGLHVTLESDANVQVVLKTTGGGYFDYVLSPQSGSNVRSAPFAGMTYMANSTETLLDLSTVYEVQFSPIDPTAFGMAVHRVELY
jgi:hypothetical protein